MSSGPILEVSHLSAGYSGHVTVSDISFTLRKGEILCLAGESGCGKSTVLKALIFSGQTELYGGSVTLDGIALDSLPVKQRQAYCCRKMGMVFQSPGSAFNPIRSYRKQFVETLKSYKRFEADAFDRQVAEAFSRVGLQDDKRILKECPYALSGGMNQRVALALAMLLRQDVLLCDEPTSALDATIGLQVASELKSLSENSGVTQIIVTHNLALARFLADQIGILYAGRLVEIGPAEELLRYPRHPYTKSLIAAIPKLDGQLPAGLAGQPPLTGPAETGCEFSDRCPAAVPECADRKYCMEVVRETHKTACRRGEVL